jgi:YD repeat-containing protein
MKQSTLCLLGTLVRGIFVSISWAAVVLGVAVAAAQPSECTDWETFLPQVQDENDVPLTYGVRKPGEGGVPFYRWERLAGPTASDPLLQHDLFPTCWWLLASPSANEGTPAVNLSLQTPHSADGTPGVRLPHGFALNINPLCSPSIGDFLPAAPTVGLSSIPLLPPGAAGLPTGWQGSTRPVLEGAVDLVTGLPLTQVTDLELPMGGATFRLTRTRSAIFTELDRLTAGQAARVGENVAQPSVIGRWWDWLGVGWMAGENPVLLIDSALPDVIGPNARTCYLVLDAHHSIPFQQVNLAVDGEGRPRVGYEAPPRFRARMTHNGTWGVPTGTANEYTAGWDIPPTQYEIWLYDGAVKYTFVAIREDVPHNVWNENYPQTQSHDDPEYRLSHYHDTPIYGRDNWDPPQYTNNKSHPGFGIPHYGICVRMEDRFGHVVEIEYCDVTRESIDDPETAGCIECQQLCLRKGQIRHIKLMTVVGEQATVHWTLLYVHRLFAGAEINSGYPQTSTNSETASILGMNAIDRIYVYPGDHFASSNPPADECLTIPSSDFPYGDNPIDPEVQWSSLGGWVHQVRYFYQPAGNASDATEMPMSPVVIMTQVQSRQRDHQGDAVTGSETSRYSFYRYSDWGEGHGGVVHRWLDRVYTADDYERMLEWAEEYKNDQVGVGAEDRRDLADYLRTQSPLQFAFADRSFQEPNVLASSRIEHQIRAGAKKLLAEMATHSFTRWGSDLSGGWPLTSTNNCPAGSLMVNGTQKYLRDVPVTRLVGGLGENAVHTFSARAQAGQLRHYRIFHLLAIPKRDPNSETLGVPVPSEFPFHVRKFVQGSSYTTVDIERAEPTRSLFVHPYRWFSAPLYGPSTSQIFTGDLLTGPAEMSEVRWVRVIDEFASASERDAQVDYSSTDPATKPGQLSRRVVSMNAAGYILTDRTWEFRGQEVLASGGGLGETYVYKSAEVYFGGTDTPLPARPTNGELDPVATVRDEPLLVQHRSVGWSAVNDPGDPETEGLVREFEFDYYNVTPDETEVPWRNRVRMVAQSVCKGTDGAQLYTKWLYYDEDSPIDLIAEVIPLSSTVASTRPQSIPEYPSDPTVEFPYSITRWVSVRVDPEATPNPPRKEWPVQHVINISPPRQVGPGSQWYFPVQMQAYDTSTGLSPWTAVGLVRNPASPTTSPNDEHESLILTYTTYDDFGRPVAEVADALPDSEVYSTQPLSSSIQVPTEGLPVGWGRIGSTSALNWVTAREYDAHGPTDVYFHNGRRWARRTLILQSFPQEGSPDPANFREEPDDPANLDTEPSWGTWTLREAGLPPVRRDFVFNDLESTTAGWVARSPGQVLDYAKAAPADQIFRPIDSGSLVMRWVNSSEYIVYSNLERLVRKPGAPLKPIRTRKVIYTQQGGDDVVMQGSGVNFLDNPTQATQPHFRKIAEVKYQPDQYGRLTDASLFERNVDGIMAPIGMKQVNDLGEVYREREMDGSITRLVKNSLGHVLRRYVGTRDDGWTSTTGEDGELPFSTEDESVNNLVLVERTEYGTGPTDAWRPTLIRRYTTNAGFDDDWHLKPYALPPGTDPHGQATRISYDWRMRPVRTDRYAQGDPATADRLLTTLTFLDHAGRERLVVTYGRGSLPSLGTDLDPALRSPTQTPEIPDPSQFLLSAGLRPLSITETRYGPDSTLSARLSYDVAWDGNGEPPYTAEYQYAGFGGVTVFRQGPGDEVERTTIDALARVVSTATVIPVPTSGSVEYLYEVARTDYTYDNDSNLIRTDRWERVIDSGTAGNTLGPANAVWSSEVNWYDVQNRLVATAEMGTGQSALVSIINQAPATLTWHPSQDRPSIDPVTGAVNRQSVPVDIPLTVHRYNAKGELEYIARQQTVDNGQPVYSLTRNRYTGFGQIAQTIENPFGGSSEQRTTSYHYRFGRLAEVHADQHGTSPSVTQQTKTLFGANPANNWGADIIDIGTDEETTRLASRSGSLPRSMHLPNETGAPSEAASVTLRYDFLGRLAERIDARGVVMRYTHDELDRLVSIKVGRYETVDSQTTFYPAHPQSLLLPNADAPVDRVGYITFDYADDHRTVDAKAYDSPAGNLIAHTRMEYDARGNLINDWQSIGAQIGTTSPRVAYEWDVQFASPALGRAGSTRLASMTYPAPPAPYASSARVVTLGYGSTGTIGEVLSRVSSITSTPAASGDPTGVAAFTYIGTGRRAHAELAGGAIVAELGLDIDPTGDNTIGLHGVDGLGRLSNLLYRQGSPSGSQPILTQLEYGYDQAGNRLWSVRTPRPIGADPATRQEQVNAYDTFDRLISSGFNNFDASNTSSLLQTNNWTLDTLGNRNALQTILPGSVETLDYTPDTRNKYTEIDSSAATDPVTPVYDAAGNLIFDGVHAFQYDAWGRVVQINRAHLEPLLENHFGDPPSAPLPSGIVVDELVKHYTYDAFGRLIRVQSPWPEPGEWSQDLRSERLYYDGLRRIQEVIIDPLLPMSMALSGEGGSQMQAAANQVAFNAEAPLDGAATPATLENQALEGDNMPATVTYLSREYVWGPGDWGVDELLVQYDQGRRASWPLQDAGGDVIALCDLGGTSGSARVITQIVYDAYGRVIGRDDPATPSTGPPELRVGHKGLFFDRLDGGIADPLTGFETPRLWPGARLSGYVRNRTLHCDFGRWNQPDPNATGLVVQAVAVYHGEGLAASVQGFDLNNHFVDGPNVYAYLGSQPIGREDPMGLFFGLAGTAVSAGMNAWDFASSGLETAEIGLRGGFGLALMISDYMTMQLDDAYWAMDWGRHDADNYIGGVAFEGYGVSVGSGDLAGRGMAFAGGVKYSRNSTKSWAKNHGYVIEKYNSSTGEWEVQKYGISSQGLNKDGESKRARYQVNEWAKDGQTYRTQTMGEFNNRRQAAEWERQAVNDYGAANKTNPPRQVRPRWR